MNNYEVLYKLHEIKKMAGELPTGYTKQVYIEINKSIQTVAIAIAEGIKDERELKGH